VPIQINQKYARCALCGKIIPLRAERIELRGAGPKPLPFCSGWCRDEYQARRAAPGATHTSAATPAAADEGVR
jgi:hypothetical protein